MRAIIIWVVLSTPLWALEVPDKSKVGDFVTIKHEANAFLKIMPERSAAQRIEIDPTTTVFTGVAGSYLLQEVFQTEGKWTENNATCVIGDVGPEPEPPGPEPDPIPPVPPVPGGLSVMIIHETADPTPPSLASITVRRYLNDKCMKVEGLPAWRSWDDDYTEDDLQFENQLMVRKYKQALLDAKGKPDWILVESTTGTTSVALPTSEADMLVLLKRYGG